MNWKKLCSVLLLLALSVGLLAAVSGADEDPVVSLSYVEQVYRPQLMAEFESLADETLQGVYADQLLSLCDQLGQARLETLQADTSLHNTAASFRVKAGDVLTLRPGTAIVLSAGAAAGSTLSDVTVGTAHSGALTQNHRYLARQETTVTITSATAVVQLSGSYRLAVSDEVDYNALADALAAMGLFRGGTSGYALERAPTRIEGLIMFLRLLGLEDEALASTAAQPFSDVPAWADRYVAYAYAQGLTQGTGSGRFSPDSTLTAQQYVTFLLRALHYDEGSDFAYASVLADSVRLGLFSDREISLVTGSFDRARMVYLSFYSLFGIDQSSRQVLLTQLTDAGTLTTQSIADGLCAVVGKRVS
jgi:hypothetical protein